jgi:hypothetical protein
VAVEAASDFDRPLGLPPPDLLHLPSAFVGKGRPATLVAEPQMPIG